MIPALALGVALLGEAGVVRLARSHQSLRSRALSFVAGGRAIEAGQELPAPSAPAGFSASGRGQAAASCAHFGHQLVSEQCPPLRANSPKMELDPEVRAIQMALRRTEQDPLAREKFYADVDSLIQRVRNHQPIPPNLMLDNELPLPPQPAAGLSVVPDLHPGDGQPGLLPQRGQTSLSVVPDLHRGAGRESLPSLPSELRTQPRLPEPGVPLPHLTTGPVLSPKGSPLDPAVVSRVVYWARVNGCPVGLALATAWQESGMALHPARGASGEIGMMQILPDRARAEGVKPSSLEDPETNLWLGTKLLARYYSEEGTTARAAMKYVAGPHVFEKRYSRDVQDYIAWYSASVNNYAQYFGQYLNF